MTQNEVTVVALSLHPPGSSCLTVRFNLTIGTQVLEVVCQLRMGKYRGCLPAAMSSIFPVPMRSSRPYERSLQRLSYGEDLGEDLGGQ